MESTDTPLKRLRLKRKLTLLDVASAVGTDTGNLSRIESGAQKSVALAEKLVEYFGRDSICESEILYPDRYPDSKKRRAEAA
jgi:transcriptional regulator with XRE-family HTH domain